MNLRPSRLPILVAMLICLIGVVALLYIYPVNEGILGYDMDPAYPYLLNGLLLSHGNTPTHIDHPGTPLQALIAATMYVVWLPLALTGHMGNSLVTAVFSHPEFFLVVSSVVLLGIASTSIWFLGSQLYRITGESDRVLCCLLLLFCFPRILPRMVYLSPESLLLSCSIVLLGLVSPLMFQERNQLKAISGKRAASIGIFIGIGTAVKITFAPMILLFLLFRSKRDAVIGGISFVVALIFSLLPIVSRLGEFRDWVKSIFLHSGYYGAGEKEFIDFHLIPERTLSLVTEYPVYYLTLFLLVFYLLYRACIFIRIFKRSRKDAWAYLKESWHVITISGVLLSLLVLQWVMVIKHFRFHYMMPALPVAAVSLLWLLMNLKSIRVRRISLLLTFCCALGYTVFTINGLRNARLTSDKTSELIQRELNSHEDPFLISYYRSPGVQPSLRFGAVFARPLLGASRPFLEGMNYYSNKRIESFLSGGHSVVGAYEEIAALIRTGRPVFLRTSRKVYPFDQRFEKERIIDTDAGTLFRIHVKDVKETSSAK